MVTTNCPICKGKSLFLFNKIYSNNGNGILINFECNFHRCQFCRTVFIYPQPDEATLASSYSSDYGSYINVEKNSKKIDSLKIKFAKWRYPSKYNIKSIFLLFLSIFIEVISGKKITYTLGVPLNYQKDAKILEVGYGTGYWLLMMKSLNYQELNGFDISNNKFYNDTLISKNINIKNDYNLLGVNWDDKFDLIRLEHVFEHISNPHEICIYLYSILSDNGSLVMTMPTIDSFVKQNKWLEISYDLDYPRHLFHYSKKSITLLLESHGFRDISVTNVPMFLNFLRNIFIKFALNEKLLDNNLLKIFRIVFAPVYYVICIICGKGEFLSVKAKK